MSLLFALIAVGALLYPIVVNYFVGQQNVTSIQNYNQDVKKIGSTKAKQMLNNATLYNAKLYNTYIYDMSQNIPWNQAIPNYTNELRVDSSGMMGYLTIPQINVANIPIYHGDSESTLAAGVGHLPQSSLPIGGVNTHTVLPAHSGRVNNTLFTNLDKLKKGDVFYIHVLTRNLKYKINDIRIVKPSDVSSLSIVKGQDLATLVTCYPTGINNKRLLVTGKRIPLSEKTPQEKIERNQFGYDFWVMAGSALLVLLALIYILWRYLAYRRRKKRDLIRRLHKDLLKRITDLQAFENKK